MLIKLEKINQTQSDLLNIILYNLSSQAFLRYSDLNSRPTP
jgi:hypothetical protein